MGKLPQEILQLLVADLTKRELFAVCLVNKALAAAAAPTLFSEIPVWISIQSLQRLTQLSEHPQLSHYVQALVVSPLSVIKGEDLAVFEHSVRDWLEFRHSSLSALELSIARYMAAYQSLITGQRFLSEKSLDLKILSRALSKFTRLEEVNIDYSNNHIGAADLNDAFGPFNRDGLLTRDCSYTLLLVLQALSISEKDTNVFRLGGEKRYNHHEIIALRNGACAVPAGCRPVLTPCARLSRPLRGNGLHDEPEYPGHITLGRCTRPSRRLGSTITEVRCMEYESSRFDKVT